MTPSAPDESPVRALPGGPATALVACTFLVLVGGVGGWLLHAMLPSRSHADEARPAAAADASAVVAEVGDEILTIDQLRVRWRQVLSADARAFHEARGGVSSYLEEAAEELLLAQEARRLGYDERPDVREAARSATHRILARPLLADLVRAKAFPEEQLLKVLEARAPEWARPARVRVREIRATSAGGTAGLPGGRDARTPEEARAAVEEARRRALAGEDFAALAREISEAPSAVAGGDVGWVEPGRFPEAYERAALALRPGETSPVFAMPDGWAVVRAEEREEARPATLEERRGEIVESLLAEDPGALNRRYRIVLDDLASRSRYVLHRDRLAGLSEGEPAGAPQTSGESGTPR